MKKRWSIHLFYKQHIQALFVLFVLAITILSVPFSYQLKHRNDSVQLGASFSTKYAQELGIDWRRAYLSLLDEVGVKRLRLMSYWDLGEPANNQYVFDDLDWQIDQASRRGVDVTLALGQRQPRWPECHVPAWVSELDEEAARSELLHYINEVVRRYRDQPSIVSYQVENEAANSLFGHCPDYDPDFLTSEIELVKSLDPSATVITNVSNQSGTPLKGPVKSADAVGFSIYKRAHFEAFGKQNGWSFWYVPSQWHSARAAIVEGFIGKDTFIHELQAEPWGPEATVNLSIEEQNKTMDPEQLRSIVEFAKQTGMKEAYLWGAEWWYWRLTEFNDDILWETVKDIYSESE